MKTNAAKTASCDSSFLCRGNSARARRAMFKSDDEIVDAVERGERPDFAAPGVPMTDAIFGDFLVKVGERIRIRAANHGVQVSTPEAMVLSYYAAPSERIVARPACWSDAMCTGLVKRGLLRYDGTDFDATDAGRAAVAR